MLTATKKVGEDDLVAIFYSARKAIVLRHTNLVDEQDGLAKIIPVDLGMNSDDFIEDIAYCSGVSGKLFDAIFASQKIQEHYFDHL